MRCLIVDDDNISRSSLQYLCDKIKDIEVVASCENGIEAIDYLQKQKIDLIFLDIEMPALSGIDLVRTLDDLPLIIFITAKKEYAADVFEFKELVVDYITKPVNLPRLIKAINRAKESINNELPIKITRDYFFIKSEGRLVRIDLDKLLYLETMGDYVRFQTEDKAHLVHSSLKNIATRFQHVNFLKVHRSFIINISKITNIEENSILVGRKLIPISRAHRAEVMKRLNPL
jgi:DNA-binding LytR/AlgR family response regulator